MTWLDLAGWLTGRGFRNMQPGGLWKRVGGMGGVDIVVTAGPGTSVVVGVYNEFQTGPDPLFDRVQTYDDVAAAAAFVEQWENDVAALLAE